MTPDESGPLMRDAAPITRRAAWLAATWVLALTAAFIVVLLLETFYKVRLFKWFF